MKLKKTDVDFFLSYWLDTEPKLKTVVCQDEINLIVERIIKRKSFQQIADEIDATIALIHLGFEAILIKIEREVSEEAAARLRTIDLRLRVKSDPFF
jgi:hypothetical protein